MNYAAVYGRLIARAQTRLLQGYSEKHHIVPRCMGGTDDPSNIVRLTAEEHFVAHQLLVKIYPTEHKLVFALFSMCGNFSDRRPNNKLVGWMRRQMGITITLAKAGIPRSAETREKIRIANTGRIVPLDERARNSASKKGRPHTAAHNAAVGAANKGRKSPMEGRKHSEETKAKMRAAALERKHTTETIAKLTQFAANQTQEQRSARAHKAWRTKHAKLLSNG